MSFEVRSSCSAVKPSDKPLSSRTTSIGARFWCTNLQLSPKVHFPSRNLKQIPLFSTETFFFSKSGETEPIATEEPTLDVASCLTFPPRSFDLQFLATSLLSAFKPLFSLLTVESDVTRPLVFATRDHSSPRLTTALDILEPSRKLNSFFNRRRPM